MKLATTLVVTAAWIATSIVLANPDPPPHNGLQASAAVAPDRKAFDALGNWAQQNPVADDVAGPSLSAVVLAQYVRGPKCGSLELIATTPMNGPCPDGQVN